MNVHSFARGQARPCLTIVSVALDTYIVTISLRSIGPALGHP
jgi:hypothetical protein